MLIDWFTVAAQIVNFLVLVWLLKRFLYGRIVEAIRARESKIAASLAEAAAKEKAAAEQLALYGGKLADFEKVRNDMLAQARAEAEKLNTTLVEKAREHVRSLETRWQEEIERQRSAFLAELRSRAATEILALARKTVADLGCLEVQQCALQTFLEKLRLLNRDGWKSLGSGELLIRSSFELPEQTRAEIRQAVAEGMGRGPCLRFERAANLGLGVELRGNGRRLGWNSESYLEALERDLREALQLSGEPAPVETP